jgi:hypothetical protein
MRISRPSKRPSAFSDDELWQLARNGFTSAFLSEDLRSRYLADLGEHRPRAG